MEIHPQAAARLGIVNDEVVRVRTPRHSMELKALVVPTIRPDTLFIPYHYGHEHSVNQLTNPAVEPNVKIPEYKACAATVEKLSAPTALLVPILRVALACALHQRGDRVLIGRRDDRVDVVPHQRELMQLASRDIERAAQTREEGTASKGSEDLLSRKEKYIACQDPVR